MPPIFVSLWHEVKGGSEVEAALSLIGLIDLKAHIVTADALHCHRRMAAGVMATGGASRVTRQCNQEGLVSDPRACLSKTKRHATAKSETRRHSRQETRVGIVVKAPGTAQHHDFPGLKA